MIRFLFVAVLVLLGNINQAKGQDTLSKKASTEKKSGPVKEVNLKSNKEQNKGSLQKGASKQNSAAKNKATSNTQKQTTLVTKGMATKIAVVLLKSNLGGIEHVIFQSRNRIDNFKTEAKILYEIYDHLDYIERFIIGIFEYYGPDDAWIVFQKYFVLNYEENQITEKIYNNWLDARKEEVRQAELKEKQEQLKQEKEQYDKWTSTGDIPAISESKVSQKAVLSAKTIELFKEKILSLGNDFFYKNFIPTKDCYDGEIPRGNVQSQIIFNLEIDKNDNVTLLDETHKFYDKNNNYFISTEQHEYQDLFQSLGIAVLEPAKYTFKELNKTIDVPSKMKVTLCLKASRNYEYHCVVGKYDKKLNQWDFDNNNYEMYREGEGRWTIERNYRDAHVRPKRAKPEGEGLMTDDEVEQLRYICSQQSWAEDTSKRVLSYVRYHIQVEITGLQDRIEINLPTKIGFSGSFDK